MSRDDITRMAREAGLTVCRDEWVFGAMLERFAALVASVERDACANIAHRWSKSEDDVGGYIEAAIRARSNT